MAQKIKVNLYYGVHDHDNIDHSDYTPITLTKDLARGDLPKGISCYSMSDQVCVYGFDSVVVENGNVWLVQMNLPPFFNEMSGAGMENGMQGMFLVGFRNKTETKKANLDVTQHGNQSCPNLIYIGDLSQNDKSRNQIDGYSENRFTFNKMSFHPFLMIDLTIGYYVCDQGGVCDWPDSNTIKALAVDSPIVYDATLGLYVTRGAHLWKPKPKAKRKS